MMLKGEEEGEGEGEKEEPWSVWPCELGCKPLKTRSEKLRLGVKL
ncbi:MAG: hypothetical protein WBZ36_08585 [Candidatus Nitrosopolaris sp.]